MLVSIFQGGFLSKDSTTTWKLLESLAKMTMQWETTRDDSVSSRIASAKGAMYAMSDLSHIDFRFIAIENQLKALAIQQSQSFKHVHIANL